MNPFDYLNILISIVLGLAIARVLAGIATVISARERVDFYWPPLVWAIWLFILTAQHWWAEFGLRYTRNWTFADFVLLLLVPVGFYLLAALVLPERLEDERVDLGEWFFRNRRWFFGIMFWLPALSIAEEILRSGHMGSTLNLAFLLLFDALVLIAFVLKSRRVHEMICIQAGVLMIAYIALLFSGLQTG